MKRTGFALLICVALLTFILPIPKRGEDGAYNTVSGLMYCKAEWACLHEIGHALDKDAGWISQSDDFADALRMYVLVNAGSDDLTIYILAMTYRNDDNTKPPKKELYAYLFEQADGKAENMPEAFRRFYDWNKAKDYINRLHGIGLYSMN